MTIAADILKYSPNSAPRAWLLINGAILAWSVLLLCELLLTISPEDRLEGTRAYLLYNFGATLIWVVEVGLHLLEHHQLKVHSSTNPNHEHKDLYWLLAELIIALYFLYDSTRVFVLWRTPDSNVRAQLLDTIINIAAYLYQVIRLGAFAKHGTASGSGEYFDIISLEAQVV